MTHPEQLNRRRRFCRICRAELIAIDGRRVCPLALEAKQLMALADAKRRERGTVGDCARLCTAEAQR